jgi:2'-5' RNA ligase
MAGFLVEFRMHGHAKEYAKETIYAVAKKFRVRGVTRKKVVPHISLYGPGTARDIRKVVKVIEKIGKRYTIVNFKVKGFGVFNTSPRVIYFDIEPSKELESLRWELSQELRKFSTCQTWDSEKRHHFHSTIAFRDIDRNFENIWIYLKSKGDPNIKQHLTRITVIGKGGRIICEYDLLLRKLLNRRESLSKYWGRKTIQKLRELQGIPKEQEPKRGNWIHRFFGGSS